MLGSMRGRVVLLLGSLVAAAVIACGEEAPAAVPALTPDPALSAWWAESGLSLMTRGREAVAAVQADVSLGALCYPTLQFRDARCPSMAGKIRDGAASVRTLAEEAAKAAAPPGPAATWLEVQAAAWQEFADVLDAYAAVAAEGYPESAWLRVVERQRGLESLDRAERALAEVLVRVAAPGQ
jgi:hypothetical protein